MTSKCPPVFCKGLQGLPFGGESPGDGETWLCHDEGRLCVLYVLNPGKENVQEDGIQKQNLNQMETKGEKEEEGAVQQQCLDACVCSGVCGGAESDPAAVLRVVC